MPIYVKHVKMRFFLFTCFIYCLVFPFFSLLFIFLVNTPRDEELALFFFKVITFNRSVNRNWISLLRNSESIHPYICGFLDLCFMARSGACRNHVSEVLLKRVGFRRRCAPSPRCPLTKHNKACDMIWSPELPLNQSKRCLLSHRLNLNYYCEAAKPSQCPRLRAFLTNFCLL